MIKYLVVLYDPDDLTIAVHYCQSMDLVRALNSLYDKLLVSGFKLRVYKLQEV